HSIRITNGPALLRVEPLSPTEDDNLIVGMEDRRTFYETPQEIVERRNRYAYVENLWRKKRLVFVTALQFGRRSLRPASFTLEGTPAREPFLVTVREGSRPMTVRFDLKKGDATVRSA